MTTWFDGEGNISTPQAPVAGPSKPSHKQAPVHVGKAYTREARVQRWKARAKELELSEAKEKGKTAAGRRGGSKRAAKGKRKGKAKEVAVKEEDDREEEEDEAEDKVEEEDEDEEEDRDKGEDAETESEEEEAIEVVIKPRRSKGKGKAKAVEESQVRKRPVRSSKRKLERLEDEGKSTYHIRPKA